MAGERGGGGKTLRKAQRETARNLDYMHARTVLKYYVRYTAQSTARFVKSLC